jgi:molybdenum cofactor cytidylyltransferase
MLGDQPGVTAENVAALLAGRGDAPIAACGYADGRGHPLAFSSRLFPELQTLHGDKAVWKLLDRYEDDAVDVAMDGPIPQDVDTWDDYRALRAGKVA